jgi:uncharacterized protein (UPF0548 family)
VIVMSVNGEAGRRQDEDPTVVVAAAVTSAEVDRQRGAVGREPSRRSWRTTLARPNGMPVIGLVQVEVETDDAALLPIGSSPGHLTPVWEPLAVRLDEDASIVAEHIRPARYAPATMSDSVTVAITERVYGGGVERLRPSMSRRRQLRSFPTRQSDEITASGCER